MKQRKPNPLKERGKKLSHKEAMKVLHIWGSVNVAGTTASDRLTAFFNHPDLPEAVKEFSVDQLSFEDRRSLLNHLMMELSKIKPDDAPITDERKVTLLRYSWRTQRDPQKLYIMMLNFGMIPPLSLAATATLQDIDDLVNQAVNQIVSQFELEEGRYTYQTFIQEHKGIVNIRDGASMLMKTISHEHMAVILSTYLHLGPNAKRCGMDQVTTSTMQQALDVYHEQSASNTPLSDRLGSKQGGLR